MKCVKCGAEIPENSMYCAQCGQKQLSANEADADKSKNDEPASEQDDADDFSEADLTQSETGETQYDAAYDSKHSKPNQETAATKKPSSRKKVIGVAAVCAVVLLAIGVFALGGHKHAWVDATCTEPKTCSECDETSGEPLGHKSVDGGSSSDYVNAVKTSYQKCSECGEILDRDTSDITTFVDGTTFLLSPEDFCERLNAAYAKRTGDAKASLSTSDGDLVVTIKDSSSGEVALGMFYLNGENSLGSSDRGSQGSFNNVAIIASDEYTSLIATNLVSVFRACDPSLASDEAKDLAGDLLDSESLTHNGLKYTFLKSDDNYILGVRTLY